MLPVFRRFTVQDIPKAPDWITTITEPLNLFCETTVTTLNKNLQVGLNVQGMKYTTSITTPANYATGGFQTISFSYIGGGQPDCCIVGSVKNNNGLLITDPVVVTDWFMNINTSPYRVTINYIAGLTPASSYTITVLVI